MNYLEQLGLGDFCEDESFFMYLLQEICENGKVFRGYYGFYIWDRLFDILEFNCHIEPDGDSNKLTGFTSHISSNCFWRLAVADTQQESLSNEDNDGEKYVLEREYDFVDPEADPREGSVHIFLVNADVIPDYHSGDLITMQVSAIASKVSYYPDQKAFENNPITTIMGQPVLYPMNRAANFLGASIVTGEIESVEKFTFFNRAEEKIPIYYINVETQYGALSIVHPASLVAEGQEEYIHPGAVISAICDIQGDVAIGDYQQGAIIDENHLVALFHSCFVERDFTRLSRQLAKDCQYVDRDEEICADGSKEVITYLAGIMSYKEKNHEPCYAWIGEVIGYEPDQKNATVEDLPPVGTRCVMLAQNEEYQVDCILFLMLDEDRKIKKIISAGWKYAPCQLKVVNRKPHNEEEDASENWERVDKPHTESEFLDMLASAYEKGDFQEESLYFGFSTNCRLEQEPANDIITHDVKDRETMYEHFMQNLVKLPNRIVQITGDAPKGHQGALRVKSPKGELFTYITLNEEGYIETLHEKWLCPKESR